ncbi:hypothetical protein PRK78_001795 [Emydomyces testavorans]|uniref:Myb/SANT-like domain-containing protein n=1 Tax=Emydomyces testavorans TaxID=2070801 RepID=A0AAF0IH09_9EURO|nr:hypothetical protein PRK78_001795 [Emydomyces testavorans]
MDSSRVDNPPNSQFSWRDSQRPRDSQLAADLSVNLPANSQSNSHSHPQSNPQSSSQSNPRGSTPISTTKQSARGRFKSSRTCWTRAMEKGLLEGLLEAQRKGLDGINGNFKNAAWTLAVARVQSVTRQSITKEICNNRWRKFKSVWKLWEKHKSQVSGWTWAPELETLASDPEVMDAYFAAHADMEMFRHRGPRTTHF